MALDPSDCANMNIRRVSRLIGQFYEAYMDEAGIRPTQFSLLVAIERLSPAPISRIAEAIGMDRTTLTRNLKLIEREGLVQEKTGEDARARHHVLTRKGEAALKKARPHWRRAQKEFLSRFGEERWQALQAELRALQGDLSGN